MPLLKNVLLVEDEMLIAMDMEQTLTELGHRVTVAASVSQALACLERETFDLAILDYHLRGADSSEVAKSARARGVPFIICSGSASVRELGDLFADAPILSKPFQTDDLVAAVAQQSQH